MSTNEQLQIKNFGPIRQADIDVRDITIFLGPQATGKSLAAQLLYFMRGMEELLVPDSWGGGKIPGDGYIARQELAGKVSALLANWLGVSGISYKDTFISWIMESNDLRREDRLELKNSPSKDGEQPRINPSLASRIENRFTSPLSGKPIIAEKQIYIPAGRVLYSFVPPSLGVSLLAHRQDEVWPGYINVFYRKLGNALRILFERSVRHKFLSVADESLNDQIFKTMKGKLIFSDPDKIGLGIEDKFAGGDEDFSSRFWNFAPLKLASGQMELWPFWALVESTLMEQDGHARVFFEEPEAHLHPSAQIALVESIAKLTRKKFHFVLTTHSPYVVYALNNFLMAQQVIDSGGTLPPSISPDSALQRGQVSAYRFSKDDKVSSIFDEETGLINTDDLDDPAGLLNRTFSEMQDTIFERQS